MAAGRKPGTKKTGGRKAGTPNRTTIAGYRQQAAAKVSATVDRVLDEYAQIAFLDIRSAFDPEGNLKSIKDFPEGLARAIAAIEFEEIFSGRGDSRTHVGRIHKIRLASKLGALDSIAKHLGMFVERHEVTGAEGGPVQIMSVAETLRANRLRRAERDLRSASEATEPPTA